MTEYRKQFLSPRREHYIPPVTLPKISDGRAASTNRSFISPETRNEPMASEYRFRYPNHQPRRPYVFHAQPSRVFDFVPSPIDNRNNPKKDVSPSFVKDTEYHERFPNYRNFVPVEDLIPPHLTAKSDLLSATQRKKHSMTQSQFFQDLAQQSDFNEGSQRNPARSEQRTAFQWPYHPQQSPPSNFSFYQTIPPISRPTFDTIQ